MQKTINNQLAYIKYAPTWMGLYFLWLIAHLPHSWQIQIGKLLGKALFLLAKERKNVASINLKLCFPELSAQAHDQLLHATIIENGIGLIETGAAWWISPDKYLDKIDLQGWQHYQAALAKGKGVVLIGAHHTTLDIAGSLLSNFMEVFPIYRKNKNPVFDKIMKKGRERRFPQVIERTNMREVLRCLKNNGTIWYAVDQDYGRKHSVFADFFGVPAATIKATSRIAKISHAELLLFSHYRNQDNSYTLELTPIEGLPSGDDQKDAEIVNNMVEQAIRKKPEQYMWVHRRFKTQADPSLKYYTKKKRRKRTRDIAI